MTWPPQSPDLNIIEHIWDYLDRKKVDHAPRNAEECFEVLQREWHNIPKDFITNLYESFPRRISAVINTEGGHSRYQEFFMKFDIKKFVIVSYFCVNSLNRYFPNFKLLYTFCELSICLQCKQIV